MPPRKRNAENVRARFLTVGADRPHCGGQSVRRCGCGKAWRVDQPGLRSTGKYRLFNPGDVGRLKRIGAFARRPKTERAGHQAGVGPLKPAAPDPGPGEKSNRTWAPG